ncbi:MAG: ABC transporter permease [Phycisphaeraceae bacterium]
MAQARLLRNVNLGVKSLLLHKLRSMLTMLGVVFGVGSVVAMLSVGEGASQEALAQIQRLGSNNIIISSREPSEDRRQGSEQTMTLMYGLLYDDARRIEESFDRVVRVVPAKIIPGEARMGRMTADLRIVGTSPDWFDLVQREIVAGRTLTKHDVETDAGVVVLAEHAARRLLGTRHVIGEPLRIDQEIYRIVGIVRADAGGGGVQTPDREVDAYIPINVARQRYSDLIVERQSGAMRREHIELHEMIVQVASIDDVEPTAAAITAMLDRFHPRGDYVMAVPLALLRQAQETQRIFSIVLGSIAGISLLVGGIGIMNIMLASVTERTREIGVRRAIGAKRRQIIGQFLIETVVLSTVGGLVGVGMGVSIPIAITYFADMPTVVTLWSVLLALGISATVGILFGLYPAYRAAMLDPIIALRHE